MHRRVVGRSYPPAADALRGKLVAVIGAQIKGCCNPTPPPPSCSFLGIPCYGVDYQASTLSNGALKPSSNV